MAESRSGQSGGPNIAGRGGLERHRLGIRAARHLKRQRCAARAAGIAGAVVVVGPGDATDLVDRSAAAIFRATTSAARVGTPAAKPAADLRLYLCFRSRTVRAGHGNVECVAEQPDADRCVARNVFVELAGLLDDFCRMADVPFQPAVRCERIAGRTVGAKFFRGAAERAADAAGPAFSVQRSEYDIFASRTRSAAGSGND